jgi:hypothetical protein
MRNDDRNEARADVPLSIAPQMPVDDTLRQPETRAVAQDYDPLVDRPRTESRLTERIVAENGPTHVQPGYLEDVEPAQAGNAMIGNFGYATGRGGQALVDELNTPLFSDQESTEFFNKWDALQVSFIDEPRRAVEKADELVATATRRTAEVFAEERARLEQQWDRGDDVSTEDLRMAMKRYRSFFQRLMAV